MGKGVVIMHNIDDSPLDINPATSATSPTNSFNVKVVSDHCSFNCYDYQRTCNEKCKSSGDLNNNGKSIINFCNYKYIDDTFEVGCVCDNGIQSTNRILDYIRYRCELQL